MLALRHCTLSSACVSLLALLGGARSLSQQDMSKRVRVPYFVSRRSSNHAVCLLGSRAELAACKTLAHPQIASARDIRPRPPCTLGYASLSALSPGLTTKLQSRTAHALCCVSGVLAPPLAPKTSHRRKAINGVFYGGYRKLQFVLSLQETYWNIEDSSAKNAAPSEVAQRPETLAKQAPQSRSSVCSAA